MEREEAEARRAAELEREKREREEQERKENERRAHEQEIIDKIDT